MSKYAQFLHPTGKVYVRIDLVTGDCDIEKGKEKPYKSFKLVDWQELIPLMFPNE